MIVYINLKKILFERDDWTDADQNILDALLILDKKTIIYEKFHNKIKKTYESINKEILKILKEYSNANDII